MDQMGRDELELREGDACGGREFFQGLERVGGLDDGPELLRAITGKLGDQSEVSVTVIREIEGIEARRQLRSNTRGGMHVWSTYVSSSTSKRMVW